MDFGALILYRRGEQPQPFRLRLGSLSIGSDPSADISIDDGLLERFHARIVCTPAGCQLTDLGSQNGTLVNKERLGAHRPQLLRDGDRIQLGRVGLLYQAPAPATPRPSDPAQRPDTPAESSSAPAESSSAPAESSNAAANVSNAAANVSNAAAEASNAAANVSNAAANVSNAAANVSNAAANVSNAPAEASSAPAEASSRAGQGERPAVQGEAAPTGLSRPAPTAVRPAPADDWDVLFQVPTAAAGAPGATLLPGNRRRRRPRHDERDLPYEAEDYLALLPPIYHDDRFMRQFLLIFKSTLAPLDQQIAQINHYFDPRTAPEHLLPWLAAWVDLVLDERWPEARRRELIGAASVLYRWRGTRRGLSDYLRIYTGVTPRIVEQGQERRGEPALPPHTFRVIIAAPDLEGVDRALVERIIEQEKPAHTAYQLEIRTE